MTGRLNQYGGFSMKKINTVSAMALAAAMIVSPSVADAATGAKPDKADTPRNTDSTLDASASTTKRKPSRWPIGWSSTVT